MTSISYARVNVFKIYTRPNVTLALAIIYYVLVRLKAQYSRPYKFISHSSHVAVVLYRKSLMERICVSYVEWCQC